MKSLRTKLVLVFTLIIVALIAGMSLITINMMKDSLIRDAYQNTEHIAEEEAKYISQTVQTDLQYVEALAQGPLLTSGQYSMEDLTTFFTNEAKRSGFSGFYLAD